jgi:hypothetical protein
MAGGALDMSDKPPIVCWLCPACLVLMTLERATRGDCCQKPERADCPTLRLAAAKPAD